MTEGNSWKARPTLLELDRAIGEALRKYMADGSGPIEQEEYERLRKWKAERRLSLIQALREQAYAPTDPPHNWNMHDLGRLCEAVAYLLEKSA